MIHWTEEDAPGDDASFDVRQIMNVDETQQFVYKQAQIQDFFHRGARKNAENQGHISIELAMYKQYIA